ncbi:MAG: hypothetical protein H0U71_09870 [Gammaproteobacteria bacterium]|nr:hypothetical protein [Gammaproteobacteria bacterium]
MNETTNYAEKSKKDLIDLCKKQSEQLTQQREQIKALTEYLSLARQRQFRAKSEKFNANQLNFFDETILPKI